ncbi:hypothetical protein FRC10_009192 [Ceratobasidium sp. 414]|nr:hypothetical protein FRC10_009192 [Ceratobasidium sp. 414]
MLSATNPSAVRQVQRAQADAIDELKQKHSQLVDTVTQLEESLEESTDENKKLYKRLKSFENNQRELESQLQGFAEELQRLQKFKSGAMQLLRTLVAGQTMDDVQSQFLAAAISSGDTNAFVKALAELNKDGEGNGEEDSGQQDAVNSCLFHLHGAVGHLKPEHVAYPDGLTPQDLDWPGEGTGPDRRPYLRFDCTKPYNNPINIDSFKELCKYIRNRGAERVPKAATTLEQATDETIQQRCIWKYSYEAEKYRTYRKKQIAALNEGNECKTHGQVAARTAQRMMELHSPPRSKKADSGLSNSPDGSQYSETQRKTMITPGAQSLDVTEYETNERGVRQKTKKFISRPWPFLSDEFVKMKADIDAIEDPELPRGYQERVTGPPREGEPLRGLLNEHLLREWMVKPDILAASQSGSELAV